MEKFRRKNQHGGNIVRHFGQSDRQNDPVAVIHRSLSVSWLCEGSLHRGSIWFLENTWWGKNTHTHNQPPLSELLQFWGGRGGRGGGGGQRKQLLTGEIVLQGGEKVTDDRHAPCLPQHLLPLLPVHVPHVGVMFGETEDSGDEYERRCDTCVSSS